MWYSRRVTNLIPGLLPKLWAGRAGYGLQQLWESAGHVLRALGSGKPRWERRERRDGRDGIHPPSASLVVICWWAEWRRRRQDFLPSPITLVGPTVRLPAALKKKNLSSLLLYNSLSDLFFLNILFVDWNFFLLICLMITHEEGRWVCSINRRMIDRVVHIGARSISGGMRRLSGNQAETKRIIS